VSKENHEPLACSVSLEQHIGVYARGLVQSQSEREKKSLKTVEKKDEYI
jgi:hypothetical protein